MMNVLMPHEFIFFQDFNEIIAEIRQILVTSSSKSSLVIMRHVFAFLNQWVPHIG